MSRSSLSFRNSLIYIQTYKGNQNDDLESRRSCCSCFGLTVIIILILGLAVVVPLLVVKVINEDDRVTSLENQLVELRNMGAHNSHVLESLEENVNPVLANASCHQISEYKDPQNGTYMIQPYLGMKPFPIRCEFVKNKSFSIIGYNSTNPSGLTATEGKPGCNDPGCFEDEITYHATMDQIEALISISEKCEQTIRHNCTFNMLTDYSWWNGRNGEKITYWHGDKDENDIGKG